MPNGGSDCCGTCPFNRANEGRYGLTEETAVGPGYCEIRALPIARPFGTYCANHPHHNPERLDVPIGPAYVSDARVVLAESPDTERIRATLVLLLERMEEPRAGEYPSATQFDHEVILQLREFREPRAGPGLRRVARFDPFAATPRARRLDRDRVPTVALAVEALAWIERDGALDPLESALHAGLDPRVPTRPGTSWDQDPLAAVRYHAVLGLEHCASERARALLQAATNDPHPKVAKLAREIEESKAGGA